MKAASRWCLCVCGLACALPAWAVDFGVMETADPIEFRNFKFIGYPLAVRDGAQREEDTGVAVGLGYGFAERWDVEGQMATYDDATYFGGDIEYMFYDEPTLDMSVSGGNHYVRHDFGSQWGFDFTGIASYSITRVPGLTVNGAVDLAWDDADLRRRVDSIDERYTTAYLVPGVQYRATRNLDVIGEIGVGLNGASNEYGAVGVSYYFR